MIAIIDYDAGNIKSVENAFASLGGSVQLTSDPEVVAKADKVVLPVSSISIKTEKKKSREFIDIYINGIKMTVAEDVTFLIECMLKERNGVAYVKEPLYIRQIDPTSAGHRYHPEIVENDREFLKNLKELVGDSFDEDITKAMRKR